ncbi:hypothetical protein PR048_020159, partial [Dryococelus australis]
MRSTFPLNQEDVKVFEQLTSDVEAAVIFSIDDEATFTVEADVSDFAVGANLAQNNRPVAFFSRSLSKSEQHHSSIEKEVYAIVEAVRKWRHFLMRRHFRLVTDQQSVAFMFSSDHYGRIKNEKIMRSMSRLFTLHEDIRKITSSCRVCAEEKPRTHKYEGNLIKATQPFERINIGVKGPLPPATRNRYMLVLRQVRHSKYEPQVDELFLLEGNPEYSYVRYPDGRETSVSTRHLVPVEGRMEEIQYTDGQHLVFPEFRTPYSAQRPPTFLESRRPSACVREEVQEGHPNYQPSDELSDQ